MQPQPPQYTSPLLQVLLGEAKTLSEARRRTQPRAQSARSSRVCVSVTLTHLRTTCACGWSGEACISRPLVEYRIGGELVHATETSAALPRGKPWRVVTLQRDIAACGACADVHAEEYSRQLPLPFPTQAPDAGVAGEEVPQ